MFKLDLHTHSEASKDGGVTPEQYAKILENEVLDYIAITDHDRIDFAEGLNHALGDKIIIGEEISSLQGEIIGLFLTKKVSPGLHAMETVKEIKKQGALVYIPHPFETVRQGITMQVLDDIRDFVDIVEVANGRAVVQNFGPKAVSWARLNKKAVAASSDAHGFSGLGHTYTVVNEVASPENLVAILSTARTVHRRPPIHSLFYPKINRLKKKWSTKN